MFHQSDIKKIWMAWCLL